MPKEDVPDDFKKIGLDLGEVALDSILDEGLMRDIPVLGTIAGIAKGTRTVRDRILINKILEFVASASTTSEKERAKFAKKLDEDEGFSQRVQSLLAVYLDRYDTTSKAGILGVIFRALVREKIDSYTFQRLSFLLDSAFSGDFARLDQYYDTPEGLVTSEPLTHLPGLVEPVDNMTGEGGIVLMMITPDGRLLTELVREYNREIDERA